MLTGPADPRGFYDILWTSGVQAKSNVFVTGVLAMTDVGHSKFFRARICHLAGGDASKVFRTLAAAAG